MNAERLSLIIGSDPGVELFIECYDENAPNCTALFKIECVREELVHDEKNGSRRIIIVAGGKIED